MTTLFKISHFGGTVLCYNVFQEKLMFLGWGVDIQKQ